MNNQYDDFRKTCEESMQNLMAYGEDLKKRLRGKYPNAGNHVIDAAHHLSHQLQQFANKPNADTFDRLKSDINHTISTLENRLENTKERGAFRRFWSNVWNRISGAAVTLLGAREHMEGVVERRNKKTPEMVQSIKEKVAKMREETEDTSNPNPDAPPRPR